MVARTPPGTRRARVSVRSTRETPGSFGGPGILTTRARAPRARHILDRLLIVRKYWFPALLVFLLICGAMLYRTLRTQSAFMARATLTIDSWSGGGSLISDLAALGRPSKVETEMEVVRSFRVARGAAELLLGLTPHATTRTPRQNSDGLYATHVFEKNAYRLWEGLLRTTGSGRQPCRLEVRTTSIPEGNIRRGYEFAFGTAGGAQDLGGGRRQGRDGRAAPFRL